MLTWQDGKIMLWTQYRPSHHITSSSLGRCRRVDVAVAVSEYLRKTPSCLDVSAGEIIYVKLDPKLINGKPRCHESLATDKP
jgi:hypothetical protein